MNGNEWRAMVRLRKRAYKRQNGICWWCKNPMHVGPPYNHPKQCSADHIIRMADGGGTTVDNIVAACRECNEKRDRAWGGADHTMRTTGDPAPSSSPFDVLKGRFDSGREP